LRQKPLPKPIPKTYVWIGSWFVDFAAGYTKKRENFPDSSKLDPLNFSLFFYPICGYDGCAIGLPRWRADSAFA